MKNLKNKLSSNPYGAPVLALGILVLLLVIGGGSWLIGRKVIALLMMPAGVIWLILWAMIFWPGKGMRNRLITAGLWLLFSFAGSPYAGIGLLRILERPYYEAEVLTEKLDALILLGGGTIESPGGNPALGTHGDRVLRPAMYYNRGLVKNLITTGRSVTEKGEDRLLSRETSEIWQELGVPVDAIIEVSEPRNTSEELAEVKKLIDARPDWKRIGLSTSASHLNRALKEARSQELDLIPVPSDFRSTGLPLASLYLVPQGRGFRDVQAALWEFLGALF